VTMATSMAEAALLAPAIGLTDRVAVGTWAA
jgi:hypothetical protein